MNNQVRLKSALQKPAKGNLRAFAKLLVSIFVKGYTVKTFN